MIFNIVYIVVQYIYIVYILWAQRGSEKYRGSLGDEEERGEEANCWSWLRQGDVAIFCENKMLN